MHPTAMKNCKSFFDVYGSYFEGRKVRVVEIGSQDVNGSLREVCPSTYEYVGVDFQRGKGVDVVLEDPYSLPFEAGSADIVLSSSCFEHSEMFWLLYLEVLRILAPHGLFYLNAPSAGSFHRFPVDCWRFYPDSGRALVKWARRSGIDAELLESYVQKGGDRWHDFVAVFVKDRAQADRYSSRILDRKEDFENGYVLDDRADTFRNPSDATQDERKLSLIQAVLNEKVSVR